MQPCHGNTNQDFVYKMLKYEAKETETYNSYNTSDNLDDPYFGNDSALEIVHSISEIAPPLPSLLQTEGSDTCTISYSLGNT